MVTVVINPRLQSRIPPSVMAQVKGAEQAIVSGKVALPAQYADLSREARQEKGKTTGTELRSCLSLLASLPTLLILGPIVRRFLGHEYVVNMAFAHPRIADAYEFRALAQFSQISRTDIAHTGLESAD